MEGEREAGRQQFIRGWKFVIPLIQSGRRSDAVLDAWEELRYVFAGTRGLDATFGDSDSHSEINNFLDKSQGVGGQTCLICAGKKNKTSFGSLLFAPTSEVRPSRGGIAATRFRLRRSDSKIRSFQVQRSALPAEVGKWSDEVKGKRGRKIIDIFLCY